MADTAFDPSQLPQWTKLTQLAQQEEDQKESITGFFARDSARFQRYSLRLGGLLLDYSKNRVSDQVRQTLLELAEHSPLAERIEAMFGGAAINLSEQRPVLHTALRNPVSGLVIEGNNIDQDIKRALDKVARFSAAIRNKQWLGAQDTPISDIVNIGIGGSDLGPKMLCQALEQFGHPDLAMHFIANVDGAPIQSLLARLNPASTLFIISSKTFTTQETMLNAETALEWLARAGGLAKPRGSSQVIAVTANPDKALEFGVPESQIFEFWDWVGGRYSLWSSLGLAVAIYIGFDAFRQLLAGAALMDEHFRNTPFDKNMPVILGLLGIWYGNFFGAQSHAIIPYCERLSLFPDYLQQLDMESNGKSVNREGTKIRDYTTGPILWGQTGTNGQHAFFQLLHQGTRLVPIDFIAAVKDSMSNDKQHRVLLGNLLAQSAALMKGERDENLPAYKQCPGNKPSNTILLDELTPFNLGSLVALYEHKVLVQGTLWNINSFDQWGVELGKKLARQILAEEDQAAGLDASTRSLMSYMETQRDNK